MQIKINLIFYASSSFSTSVLQSVISPSKEGNYIFISVSLPLCLFVCLSICLSLKLN